MSASSKTITEPVAYLVMTNTAPEDWCAAIGAARQMIGRADDAEIQIPQRFRHVSRRHAEIWAELRGIRVRDLGSRAGTHVNGVWVGGEKDASVAVGDRIWAGGLELEVVDNLSTLARILGESGASMRDLAAHDDPGETSIRRDTVLLPARFALAELSQAELDIILWIGRGYMSDKELGETLHRSPNTVRTQVNSIFRKLGVHSRNELIAWLKRPSRS